MGGGGDWVSSLSGVAQEYCVTSVFRARGLSGLRHCWVLDYKVQLLPRTHHHQFNWEGAAGCR